LGQPGAGHFPQVAGIRFSFDPSRPVGQRIVSVTTADGLPILADDTVYTVAALDFIATVGDDYTDYFTPVSAVVQAVMVDVLVEALRADTGKSGSVKLPGALLLAS
jgi:2',3'-cyclic-nucleotide 2'-phosphodiesterase (5'-nucleotidase family)